MVEWKFHFKSLSKVCAGYWCSGHFKHSSQHRILVTTNTDGDRNGEIIENELFNYNEQ